MRGGRSSMAALLLAAAVLVWQSAVATADMSVVLPTPPVFQTTNDLNYFLYDIEQELKMNMTQEIVKEYNIRKREAGVLQANVVGLGEPTAEQVDVSATDFFTFGDRTYAVVSQRTLNESYIGLVTSSGENATVHIQPQAPFSVQSFIDIQYNATFLPSLQHRVVELKAHVYNGKVYIMAALEHSLTLLFMVSDPHVSWTPKYQDSVLGHDEVASDFAFFEENGQLRVLVTVSHRHPSGGGNLLPAHQSYIYGLSGGIKWLEMHTVATPQGATSVSTFTDKRWTYIVIGQNYVQSLVYRHHWDTQALELFQYLPSRQALSVEAFYHAQQTFVLMVNAQGNATIFWWSSDQLFVWQSLLVGQNSERAKSGHVGSFGSDEKYFYIVSKTSISFYTSYASYTGHFSLALSHSFGSGVTVLDAQVTHATNGGHYLLVSLGGRTVSWNIYTMIVAENHVVPQPPERDPLLDCLAELAQALDSLDRQLDQLLTVADMVFINNGARNVTAPLTVSGDLTLTGPADVYQLHINSNETDGVEVVPVEDLQDQIETCNATISELSSSLQTALTHSTAQTITGQFSFSSISVLGTLFVSDATSLQTLHGVSLQQLLDGTLTFSSAQDLQYPLLIGSGSVNQLTAAAGASINGLSAGDLMFTSGAQTVSGRHHYHQLGIDGDLWLSHLNGLDLGTLVQLGQILNVSRASLASGTQISNLRVTNLNGVVLSDWERSVIRLDLPHTFSQPVTLPSATFEGLRVTHLNGHVLSSFLQSLWRSGNDLVAGTTIFAVSPSVGRLSFTTVNGVRLDAEMLTSDSDQVVTSHIQVDSLDVTTELLTDRVNGLDLSTDVVRTTGLPNAVNGTVVFESNLLVTGDVILAPGATVNEVDISEAATLLNASELHFSQEVRLDGRWTVHGSVNIVSINGIQVSQLRNLFWAAGVDQEIPVSVTISNALTVSGDLAVATINGVRTGNFIDVVTGGTIQNEIIFTGNVTASDVVLPPGGLLNDYDLSEFAKTVATRTDDQIISGIKTFSREVFTSDIVVGTINDLDPMNDILLVDMDQIQIGSLTFTSDIEASAGVVTAGDVVVSGTINGHDVGSIRERLTNIWINRTTGHTLVIQGSVHFSDLHVERFLNGVDLTPLLDGLLMVDRDAVISNTFTVNGGVRFNSGLQLNTVNGLDWTSYLSSLILTDVGGTVSGTTTLSSSLAVTSPGVLSVTSLNGYTLQQLQSQYLTLGTDQVINHRVIITGSVAADTVQVDTVNGVPTDQLMFTDQELHFFQSLHLFSRVDVAELGVSHATIGDCNLTQIWQYGLRKNAGSQTLHLPVSVRELSVSGDVILDQSDVREQLRRLLDRIVTTNGNHNITGDVTFQQGLSVTSPVIGIFNGGSLSGLYGDAITHDVQTLVLEHPVTVLGGVTFGDVTVTSEAVLGLVNGVDLAAWYDSLVLRSMAEVQLRGELRLQQASAGHVAVSGLINGLPPSSWLEIGDVIPADVYFDAGLNIVHNIAVRGRVDGVNVTAILERAVNVLKGDVVRGNIVFTGAVTVLGDVTAPQINDVTLTDVLLNHQLTFTQLIPGHKHFGTLLVDGSVCGLVGGLNLTQHCSILLNSQATGQVQHVTGHLTFATAPANLENSMQDMVDDIGSVYGQLVLEKEAIATWMAAILTNLTTISASAASLTEQPDYSVDMAYLLLVQRLAVPDAVAVHSVPQGVPVVHVLVRSLHGCQLPVGCLCRSTAQFQVREDGLLVQSGVAGSSQKWVFQPADTDLVFTVTAVSDSYSSRCQRVEHFQLTVTSRPANQSAGPETRQPISAVVAGYVTDVQIFSHGGQVYMVVGYGFARGGPAGSFPASQLYRLQDSVWTRVQSLPAHSVQSLDVTETLGLPHLLVVSRFSRQPLSLQSEVQLWAWNTQLQQFEEITVLYHADVQSARFLHAHDKLYVVVADLDGLTVAEYVAEQRVYRACQYLAEPGVSAVTSFVIGAESYLVVFSGKLNQIVVYLVTHQEGLERHCWYPATAVRSLAVYAWNRQLFIVAVHADGLIVYRVVVRGRLSLVTTSAARLPLLS